MLSFLCINLVDSARTNGKKGGRKLDVEIRFFQSLKSVVVKLDASGSIVFSGLPNGLFAILSRSSCDD